jgi:hypothetical protein
MVCIKNWIYASKYDWTTKPADAQRVEGSDGVGEGAQFVGFRFQVCKKLLDWGLFSLFNL